VSISGITATVRIDTEAGGVRLTNVSGEINVTAVAVAVTGTALTDTTTVESTAASVDLAYVTPPLNVNVTSDAGSIRVRVPSSGTYAVDATVLAGRRLVDVPVDPCSVYRITVRSGAGSVEVIPA